MLPIFGVLCSLVGAAAIALLFVYHTEVGLQYTTETAIYLVAMFVARRGLVGHRARSMRREPGHRPRPRVQGDPARMRLGRRRIATVHRKRICFVTDVHGSERCFRKFLNTAKFYDAQYLILGGDITGKTLVPIERGPHRLACLVQRPRVPRHDR